MLNEVLFFALIASVYVHADDDMSYVEMFKEKRAQHKSTLESIKEIAKEEQPAFFKEALSTIENVMSESRDKLESLKDQATDAVTKDDETVKEAISRIYENMAYFSDLSLSYSKYFKNEIKNNKKLQSLINWAYNYIKEAGDKLSGKVGEKMPQIKEVIDEDTLKKLHLMAQQHGIIEKTKDYMNPFDSSEEKDDDDDDEDNKNEL